MTCSLYADRNDPGNIDDTFNDDDDSFDDIPTIFFRFSSNTLSSMFVNCSPLMKLKPNDCVGKPTITDPGGGAGTHVFGVKKRETLYNSSNLGLNEECGSSSIDLMSRVLPLKPIDNSVSHLSDVYVNSTKLPLQYESVDTFT